MRELPGELKTLTINPKMIHFDYVWFDVLCILQDNSDIGAREIGRQATIFKNATFAVAWLNDTGNFAGLQRILQWEALYLCTPRSHGLVDSSLKGVRFEILGSKEDPHSPNPWFTSLWTL